MNRLIIYTKDVQILTGLSKTTAKLRMAQVRVHFGIPKRGPVTFAEFCEFFRLNLQMVLEKIGQYYKK
ncbi:MAG: hypothetical protein V4594_05325 [Bacteroidota bacterium]